MTDVCFDPAKLTGEKRKWWDDWIRRADRATEAVIAAWERGDETLPFKEALWGELKNWLLENVFHGKCAYCETKILRFSGDAEHYRPKSEVTVRNPGTRKLDHLWTVDESGKQIVHPGYFWLAHHWKNILPSCESCNRRHGKLTQFPLAEKACHILRWKKGQPPVSSPIENPRESPHHPGWLYLGPDDLDRIENPLLLNPFRKDPQGSHPLRRLRDCRSCRGEPVRRDFDPHI